MFYFLFSIWFCRKECLFVPFDNAKLRCFLHVRKELLLFPYVSLRQHVKKATDSGKSPVICRNTTIFNINLAVTFFFLNFATEH